MQQQSFMSSSYGRALTLLLGLAVAGPGALALLGPAAGPLYLGLFLAVLAGMVLLGLRLEGYPEEAGLLLLLTALLAGPYLVALSLAPSLGRTGGLGLLLMGGWLGLLGVNAGKAPGSAADCS